MTHRTGNLWTAQENKKDRLKGKAQKGKGKESGRGENDNADRGRRDRNSQRDMMTRFNINYETTFFLFGKYGDMKDFRMFDTHGQVTDNISEAAMVEDVEYNRQALMEAAQENKNLNAVFQLRTTFQDVVWQTPS